MAVTAASVQELLKKHRLTAEAIGVSVFALVVFVSLGGRAQKQTAPLANDITRLRTASTQIASFRAAFHSTAPEEDLRLAARVDSLHLTVARELRFTLAQQMATQAEAAGLRGVRVVFSSVDSAAPPPRLDLLGKPVGPADYALTITGKGNLTNALSLIRHLPSSVAFQRLIAVRRGGVTEYTIGLAVFEAGGGVPQHG